MKKVLISLFLVSLVWGSNEIRITYNSSLNLYSCIRNSSGQVWYISGQTFEDWGTGARDADDYDIGLEDKSGNFYIGDFNTAISAGYYTIVTYRRDSDSPADTDPALYYENGYWDETTWRSTSYQLQTILTDTTELQTDDIPGTLTTLTGYSTNIMADSNELITDLDQVDVDINDIEEYVSNIMADSNEIQEDTSTTLNGLLTNIMADSNAIYEDTDSTIPATITTLTGYATNIMADSNDLIDYAVEWDPNFTATLADTNELQEDWTNGGRLDLLIDAIKLYTDMIVIVETDVNEVTDANSFTLTAGEATADVYNNYLIMVQDADDSLWEVKIIKDWGSDLEVTIESDFTFTPAENDLAYVMGWQYLGNIWLRVQNLGMVTNVVNKTSGSGAGRGEGTTIFDTTGSDP